MSSVINHAIGDRAIIIPIAVGSNPPDLADDGLFYIFDTPKSNSLNTYKNGAIYPNVVVGDAFQYYNLRWNWAFHFGTANISGLTSVASDTTLTGVGTTADPLKVAKPAAETGAEVNPLHEIKFSCLSSDTQTDIDPSQIGFYVLNSEIQSGSIKQATRIDIPAAAAPFLQDPSAPGTDLSAVDTSRLFGDIDENGGQIVMAILKQGTMNLVYVQAEVIAAKDGGWSLSELTWVGDETIHGTNDNWSIVAAISHGFTLTKDIPDLSSILALYVRKTELEGKETDRYGSYGNALISETSDRRGGICLFDQATGPPTDANAIGQPDIADRDTNGIIVFAAILRTDKDPNNLQWAPASVASDYVSGQVYHISIWDRPSARVKVTLTSGGTIVDTGNAAYIYATATWDEVNDIPDVSVVGNYFLIGTEEPSDLDIRLSAKDILNAPWFSLTGNTKTDADISNDTQMVVNDGDSVALGEIYEHHDQNHTGSTLLAGYNFKTGSATPDAGDVAAPAPLEGIATGAYYIKPADDDEKALLKNILIAHKRVRFQVSKTRYIEFKPNGTPAELFGRLVGNYISSTYRTRGAALTNDQAISLSIQSNIPALDELRELALKEVTWDDLTEVDSIADNDLLLVAKANDSYNVRAITKSNLTS